MILYQSYGPVVFYYPYNQKNEDMSWTQHIEQKPDVLLGKPVIKGTRTGVDLIFGKIGNGESIDNLISEYPHLNENTIHACVSYGASQVHNEILIDVG